MIKFLVLYIWLPFSIAKKMFREWRRMKVRKDFCEQELKPGNFLVLWKDIDNEISGWAMPADDEAAFNKLVAHVSYKKIQKLEDITGIKIKESD